VVKTVGEEGTGLGLAARFRRLMREPLIHFFLFAGLFLGAYQLLTGEAREPADIIVVSGERIEQFSLLLSKSLQRPPTEQELKAAIDDYVKEEIYYREAVKLGLDQDDTVIRRRLRQKMEFLGDAMADQVNPSEAELESYFRAHTDRFATEPELAFQQVFLSSARHGKEAAAEADGLLTRLRSEQAGDFTLLGDSTTLPAEMPLTPLSGIVALFGAEFGAALSGFEIGDWSGPIETSFGLHIVRITERKEGAVPDFAAVRDEVAREWMYAKRRELEDMRFAAYLKKYQVKILVSEPAPAP